MSWAALPVEPACMGKAVGEAGRPLMLCGARLYIITYAKRQERNTMQGDRDIAGQLDYDS